MQMLILPVVIPPSLSSRKRTVLSPAKRFLTVRQGGRVLEQPGKESAESGMGERAYSELPFVGLRRMGESLMAIVVLFSGFS